MKLKRVRIFKACLVLTLCFSILPEVVFSFEDSFDKVKINSLHLEETNTCNETNCPMIPGEPCQQCPVCCIFPHYYVESTSMGVTFGIIALQPSTLREDILYEKMLAKAIFHPPQSIL
ncbi:MAG: hypothetical protein SCARUB_04909 [Candidatus Scalindua rubra]|uniref:Uncharacterized protein n=1 Tax=Candidatus Scalindua rubra TaxID=1872076 RepID=A0A1E3X311_9BACT|nr:MAG: hypothetical protein SCARUB_04909 [Candidatus Scalindua rubra]